MAANITQTLQMVIENIGSLNTIVDNLQQLGRRHVQYDHGIIFRSNYWDRFADAFADYAIDSDGGGGSGGFRCRETMNAWRLLVQFIIRQVHEGYDQQRLLQTAARRASIRTIEQQFVTNAL